ncbi:AaceriAAL033Wp [[Ashbya] aceris (nom. inval.)]|nr:AaceriAAL033Wp [[Ashbya] aceris (nom. inval.)]
MQSLVKNLGKMALPARYLPPVHRGITQLDKSVFTRSIPLVVVSFPDPRNISVFSKRFKEEILRVPRIPHVVRLAESSARTEGLPPLKKQMVANDNHVAKGVLLKDSVHRVEDVKQQLSADAQTFLEECGAALRDYDYTLDYDFYHADEILRSVLPEEFQDEVPSGFTATGHVAHVNLRNELKPYGPLIGQVILDKNRQIETVVDKVDAIASQFRTFQMNVLAGRPDLVVTQRESNCAFTFDFSKVYWNSRLHTEHDRLVRLFEPGQLVADVFAGVGPFAIPAAKKQVLVLANDLNPESFRYLRDNIAANKVDGFVRPTNLDGRDFIRTSPALLRDWTAQTGGSVAAAPARRRRGAPPAPPHTVTLPRYFHHYVMNLPDSALSFLNEFAGLYSRHGLSADAATDPAFVLPYIHCHCFEKYSPDEPEPTPADLHARIHRRVLTIMDTTADVLPMTALSFHLVRKVAPTKPMFCVTFQLPQSIAFRPLATTT